MRPAAVHTACNFQNQPTCTIAIDGASFERILELWSADLQQRVRISRSERGRAFSTFRCDCVVPDDEHACL